MRRGSGRQFLCLLCSVLLRFEVGIKLHGHFINGYKKSFFFSLASSKKYQQLDFPWRPRVLPQSRACERSRKMDRTKDDGYQFGCTAEYSVQQASLWHHCNSAPPWSLDTTPIRSQMRNAAQYPRQSTWWMIHTLQHEQYSTVYPSFIFEPPHPVEDLVPFQNKSDLISTYMYCIFLPQLTYTVPGTVYYTVQWVYKIQYWYNYR